MGAATAIMLFVSVLLHELGHSMVAMSYKIRVQASHSLYSAVSPKSGRTTHRRGSILDLHRRPCCQFRSCRRLFLLQPVFAQVEPLLALGKYLVYINLMLGLFNLIPGFPWMAAASFGRPYGASPTICVGPP